MHAWTPEIHWHPIQGVFSAQAKRSQDRLQIHRDPDWDKAVNEKDFMNKLFSSNVCLFNHFHNMEATDVQYEQMLWERLLHPNKQIGPFISFISHSSHRDLDIDPRPPSLKTYKFFKSTRSNQRDWRFLVQGHTDVFYAGRCRKHVTHFMTVSPPKKQISINYRIARRYKYNMNYAK